MAKSLSDNFSDWESSTFGFGYGTGEPHIIPALRMFLEGCLGETQQYDYRYLEKMMGPLPAWLMINALCRHDVQVIDYGSSPRFGWLTPEGVAVKAFVVTHTDEELLALTCRDSDYAVCYPNACNCGPDGYQAGVKCDNPFWKK